MLQGYKQQYNISKSRLFKVALLLTPYDRLMNAERYNVLSALAVTICNTKCTNKKIVDEEWINFYTTNECYYEIHIFDKNFAIYYVTKEAKIKITDLFILKAPNIRIQCKDATIQIKYYLEWEAKIQITFYTNEEAMGFMSMFNELLKMCFGDCQRFLAEMEILNGDIENINIDDINETRTLECLIEEYKNIVNE